MNPAELLDQMNSLAGHLAAWAADPSMDGLGSQPDEVVLAVAVQLEEIDRKVSAAQVHAAAVVNERTDVGGISDGLAVKYGFTRAVPFLEHITRIPEAEARHRVRVGKNIRGRMSMTGEPLPPQYPTVATAVARGLISPQIADRIIGGLDQARKHHIRGENEQPEEFEQNIAAAEDALVEEAQQEPADYVAVQVTAWRDALDPDGAPLRDEDIRQRRGLWRGKERNGTVKWTWITTGVTTVLMDELLATAKAAHKPRFVPADPEHADPAAPDASQMDFDPAHLMDPDGITLATPEESRAMLAGDTLDGVDHERTDPNRSVPDCEDRGVVTALKDTRSHAQRDNDVLDGYLRAGARASENELGSIRDLVEVIAVATVADLEAGRGVGWINGLDEPVSIDFVKELACSSGYRLVVQGDDGETLWMGKKPRRFEDHQKRAVIVRDGPTCAAAGCHKPARQTDVHHVEFYSQGGPTNIDNAVCLCSEHHHMIHQSPFTIEMHNGKPFMLAPRWLDPSQTWKPMGHPRYRNRPQVHNRTEWTDTLGD